MHSDHWRGTRKKSKSEFMLHIIHAITLPLHVDVFITAMPLSN